MKTSAFLNLLAEHQEKSLVFAYAPNQLVGAHYHITEVKHVTIDAVDCGTGTDKWNETVIQLWENPGEIDKPNYMSAYKALGILKKVGALKAYIPDALVKIEYGNAVFHTTQLQITAYEIKNDQLRIQLATVAADCKAKEACGITEDPSENAACTPGSGCC